MQVFLNLKCEAFLKMHTQQIYPFFYMLLSLLQFLLWKLTTRDWRATCGKEEAFLPPGDTSLNHRINGWAPIVLSPFFSREMG